jgi:predicted P-loop ATPase
MSAEGFYPSAGPAEPVVTPTLASDAIGKPIKRQDVNAVQMGRVGQILGVERFDVELEAWLADRQWTIRLNRLSEELEIHRPCGIVPMSDERLAEIRFTVAYASNGKEPAKDKIADAVALIGERRAYHPVLDYLDGIKWDGVERLDRWLVDYLGADDTPLNRAFGRKILCAAVRRIKQPGCKFDSMLVLEGAQDIGKSSAVVALCPDRGWFTDQLEVGADPRVTIEKTSGAWLIEMPELDGMGKRDTNRVKSFITTTHDRARLAYGRYAVTRARQFVLFGTTNESQYLSDTTGNRRFWIVRVTKADPASIVAVRDQLWAEAVYAEPAESLWLDDPELKDAAAEVTRAASDFGPWLELLEGKIPSGPLKVEATEVWRLVGIEGAETINKLTKSHHVHMKAAMMGLGFERKDAGIRNAAGKKVRAYVRGELHSAAWWRTGELHPSDRNLPNDW